MTLEDEITEAMGILIYTTSRWTFNIDGIREASDYHSSLIIERTFKVNEKYREHLERFHKPYVDLRYKNET